MMCIMNRELAHLVIFIGVTGLMAGQWGAAITLTGILAFLSTSTHKAFMEVEAWAQTCPPHSQLAGGTAHRWQIN